MPLSFPLVALILVSAADPTTSVAPHRRTITDTYRVSYQPRSDRYCLRVFADPAPADPRPQSPPDPCRSRAGWVKEGIVITDPARDRAMASRR
ncbi:hypothetical protein U1872_08655 [Sphingomonas sp. RB3P16]|uniref:hypothetical protein n=1 Tax=Parasphingomonas frigoris TaxID=3096163 RepID=UPI002FCAD088